MHRGESACSSKHAAAMDSGFRPIGQLPPRRVSAALSVSEVNQRNYADLSQGIVIDSAQDRLRDIYERVVMPQDLKGSLDSAINGNMEEWSRIVQAMFDTWPRLQKNVSEIQRAARKAPWKCNPYTRRGGKPTPKAEELADELGNLIWETSPRVECHEMALEGMVESLVMAYFSGFSVTEVMWENAPEGWIPRAYKNLPARCYGYPTYGDYGEDRLMLNKSGSYTGEFEDFASYPNKFLIGIRVGHDGHPLLSSPLRVLTGWWLACVFGLQWFMEYAQLFGVPFRHVKYSGDANGRAQLCAMMQQIGSAGYMVTDTNADVTVVANNQSAANLPQKELLSMADEQCDTFILGQTLTTSVGDSGSRALGTVHEGVRQDVIEGVCDFVGTVITKQLIPYWMRVNYGNTEEAPEFYPEWPEPKDEKAEAERMEILTRIGVPMPQQYVYETLGVPIPTEGETLFTPIPPTSPGDALPDAKPANGVQGDPATGRDSPHETKRVTAAEAKETKEVDKLVDATLEGLTGVQRKWLAPVKPFFLDLIKKAESEELSDDDFLEALEKTQRELPEVFGMLDTQALEEAFQKAIGTGMIAGATNRHREQE